MSKEPIYGLRLRGGHLWAAYIRDNETVGLLVTSPWDRRAVRGTKTALQEQFKRSMIWEDFELWEIAA